MMDALDDKKPDTNSGSTSSFTGGSARNDEPRSWKPFAIAGVVVLAIVGVLFLVGRHAQTPAFRAGTLAQADSYASSLPLTEIKMSEASGIAGNKQTYLDGTVTNRGSHTVTGITVQVAFKDYTGALATVDTQPLNLIRFRQPYVDSEPVSMDPIQPGQARPFRLIFDAVPDSWSGAYPEVRIVSVAGR